MTTKRFDRRYGQGLIVPANSLVVVKRDEKGRDKVWLEITPLENKVEFVDEPGEEKDDEPRD